MDSATAQAEGKPAPLAARARARMMGRTPLAAELSSVDGP